MKQNIPTAALSVMLVLLYGPQTAVGSFFEQTHFLPVNHTVVMQRHILEANPWVPEALFESFQKSKQDLVPLCSQVVDRPRAHLGVNAIDQLLLELRGQLR